MLEAGDHDYFVPPHRGLYATNPALSFDVSTFQPTFTRSSGPMARWPNDRNPITQGINDLPTQWLPVGRL
ncbi:predicted protein [Botrytis cinerea T4]|uniref:Uncharacterized protein n=1 Tax=Botryotinia fuckeliana (strain T4) TaxID=999810 RepID=G2YSA5_BOTF4|nr:predicted protein [Botrytis cinerea T4]